MWVINKLKKEIYRVGQNIVCNGISNYYNKNEGVHERNCSNALSPDPKGSDMWHEYYNKAEAHAIVQFDNIVTPILSRHGIKEFGDVLDFACGFGRMSNVLRNSSRSITCCDISASAIEFCKERFLQDESDNKCMFHFCNSDDSLTLPFLDEAFDFIFSWDAMVHFKYKWLDSYINEFHRICKNGSYVLIHHSNYGNIDRHIEKSENWIDNPHCRANVTAEDVVFIANKHNFMIVEQTLVPWGISDLDCVSLLKK
jgi:SAM-dependent methyltransferase